MSGMSSLLEVNTLTSDEGESILPEVAELVEFHPDHLSSLEDIQEELDKLRAGEDVGIDDVMSMSTVDNVNVVDHEVTIVADQGNEDLPEPAKINQKENFNGNSVNTIIDESLGIGETITIRTPNVSESRLIEPVVSKSQGDLDQFKMSSPTKPLHQVSMSQLKAIRPLPDAFKGNKSIITMAQPKKNVLTKVIFTPNNHAAPDAPIIFGEAGGQTIRIVGQNKTIITNSPKTITLAQARDMGLLSPGKMQQLLPNHPKGMVKKGVMMGTNKAIAMMKSSPTKILPLPTTSQLHPIAPSPSINSLTPHKIFIRQTHSTIKSGAFPSTLLASSAGGTQQQILQLPVSQDNANHQIHQIQLPGKQVQYVRLVNSVSSSVTAAAHSRPLEALAKPEPMLMSTSDVGTRPVPVALTANLSNVSNSPQIKIMPLAPVQTMASSNLQSVNSFERVLVSPGLSQLTSNPDSKSPSSNIVMVPAEYVKQFKPISVTQSPPSPPKPVTTSTTTGPSPPALLTKAKEFLSNREPIMTLTSTQSTQKMKPPPEPQNGMRPRKPCNCTKSQCLKLYCDCFANGEFCFQCNCNCCFNNLDHEEERQRAIKACLERNPNAFRPKIGKGYVGDERRHNKGCNCKRSGCLKNYCECYEAKIPCSKNCKCIGCRNVEEAKDSQNRHNEGSKPGQINSIKSKLSSTEIQEIAYKPHTFLTSQGPRQPFNLMTQEVVQATCQCLLAQVEGDKQLTEQVERLILEEFGRCLVEIIDCATRTTTVNNAT